VINLANDLCLLPCDIALIGLCFSTDAGTKRPAPVKGRAANSIFSQGYFFSSKKALVAPEGSGTTALTVPALVVGVTAAGA
jgi:hypothetical protein